MGIMIKSSSLAAINRKAKRQPTRILRYLMDELFSEEELKGSTVRGRKGKLPPLDEETMDAILCKYKLLQLRMKIIAFYCRLCHGKGRGMGKSYIRRSISPAG